MGLSAVQIEFPNAARTDRKSRRPGERNRSIPPILSFRSA
jgi:hypothetical protein